MRDLIEWLRAAARPLPLEAFTSSFVPLPGLVEAVGDARLALLAEARHFDAQEHAFRNCLFRNLVEEKGFSAIAIESGLIEGRTVHDFVRGAEGKLEQVVSDGLTWGFGEIDGNRDLIRWLRLHNGDRPSAGIVNYYGSGTSGMPSTRQKPWRYGVALATVIDFLEAVDPIKSRGLRSRLGAIEPISFHTQYVVKGLNYADLPTSRRVAISAIIRDLEAWLDCKAADYVARSSEPAFAWARRAAANLRQLDDWLQQVPVGWKPSQETSIDFPRFFDRSSDIGDQAQADNLDWVMEREGTSARILAYASRYHLNTAPWHDARWGLEGPWHRRRSAGSFLRKRWRDAVVSIGHLIVEPTSECSVDKLIAGLAVPPFFVDLRHAPSTIARQLETPQILGGDAHALRLVLAAAFDLLVVVPGDASKTMLIDRNSSPVVRRPKDPARRTVGACQVRRRSAQPQGQSKRGRERDAWRRLPRR